MHARILVYFFSSCASYHALGWGYLSTYVRKVWYVFSQGLACYISKDRYWDPRRICCVGFGACFFCHGITVTTRFMLTSRGQNPRGPLKLSTLLPPIPLSPNWRKKTKPKPETAYAKYVDPTAQKMSRHPAIPSLTLLSQPSQNLSTT